METVSGFLMAMLWLFAVHALSGDVSLVSTVVGLLIGAATIISIIFGIRYKVAFETERAARQAVEVNSEAVRERADRMENLLREESMKLAESRRAIARLEQMPNYEKMLDLMVETAKRQQETSSALAADAVAKLTELIDRQESRHEARHLQVVRVLEKIAERLEA